MLVLTRKRQEQIHIGDDIVLTVLRVKGNTVRVGIEAPRDVRVLRGELPPKEEREVELVITGESNDAFSADEPSNSDNSSAEETIGETEGLRLVRHTRETAELAGAV